MVLVALPLLSFPVLPPTATMATDLFLKAIEAMETAVSVNNLSHKNTLTAPAKALINAAKLFKEFHDITVAEVRRASDEAAERNMDVFNTATEAILTKIESLASTQQPTLSYSDALKKKPKISKQTIIVKAKDGATTPAEIKEKLCLSIDPSDMKCSNVFTTKGNVVFELEDKCSKDKLINKIRSDINLNGRLEAYEPRPKCPTIMIQNIDYSTDEHDLPSVIADKNDLDVSHFKVLYTIKKKLYYDAVLVISPHLYDQLLMSDSPIIRTRWTASQVKETFLVNYCTRCSAFGHGARQCKEKQMKRCRCGKQFKDVLESGEKVSQFRAHVRSCNELCCHNCSNHSNGGPVDHRADSVDCPVYRARQRYVDAHTCRDDRVITFESSPQKNPSENIITNDVDDIDDGSSLRND